MIVIDGSYGEGGGQILRLSIALSCITGSDVKIFNIRAKRDNPGLRPQHVTSVKIAEDVCRARTEGVVVGSTEIVFSPSTINPRSMEFDVGTAGSVTLIMQTILPILAFSERSVEVVLKGGTDVPWSPPVDYVRYVMLPHLSRMGYRVEVDLLRRGHYPRGGGVVKLKTLNTLKSFSSLNLTERGRVRIIRGISHSVKLPKDVAVRQAESAKNYLKSRGVEVPAEISLEFYEPDKDPHLGPGSGIVLWAETENSILGGDSLGAKGKRAELVGVEAAEKLLQDLNTGAALDRHMSDNILIYLALSEGPSTITGAEYSMHAHTALWVLKQFLRIEYDVRGELGKPFRLTIQPRK
ncbi:MAG: RNA 3'-terminal phosphate cyclase [Desulfurococcaceae archaeon TW002]